MIKISSHEEFEQHLGKVIGTSEYHKITQEQINLFADATLDHQWIHTDAKRAETESPFKNTIAHGYLTLSLVPYFWKQIIEINNLKMEINYGTEKLKFNQAVTVNSEVRMTVKLASILNLRGVTKCALDVEMEIKGSKKSAFNGTLIFLYHFI